MSSRTPYLDGDDHERHGYRYAQRRSTYDLDAFAADDWSSDDHAWPSEPDEWDEPRPARGRGRAPLPGLDDDDDDRPRRRSRSDISDDERPRRRTNDPRVQQDRERRRSRRTDKTLDMVQIQHPGMDRGLTDRVLEAPPRRRAPRSRRQRDEVVSERAVTTSAVTTDVVTGVRAVPPRRRARRRTNPAWQWSWSNFHLPQVRQIIEQALPHLVAAVSLLTAWLTQPFLPTSMPLWAVIAMAPMLALSVVANRQVHPNWLRTSLLNFLTIGVFLPMVIVRQSYVRVPFVAWGNGTLMMPVMSTLAVIAMLTAMALLSAWLTQEDPEYAGSLFAPAALLVPFFVGVTEITSLSTALIISAAVFGICAVATVVISMLPGAFPTLVVPAVLALEFFALPLLAAGSIFPLGAGLIAKMLFFLVLVISVALTIVMPFISMWIHQVRVLVQRQSPASA